MSGITKKEKIEIGFVLGSVLIVVIVGLSLQFVQTGKLEALAGAAVKLDPKIPTYPGTLVLLKDYCTPKSGSGNCNSICGKNVCIPINNDCDKSVSKNTCLCCDYPK
tara:strand:+ start:1024 stop:1344 length:321 start_codon:yes stop_codon:yes gene_type:complete